jgi:hypothetical protein
MDDENGFVRNPMRGRTKKKDPYQTFFEAGCIWTDIYSDIYVSG